MMTRVAMTAVLLAALTGCGRKMADENPSCCLYECEGPRQQWFSSYFGSEARCNELVESRCALEFPEQPGVVRAQYQGGVAYDEMLGLNVVCEEQFETFRTDTSTDT